jgi:CheY-like chemotaxis protein
MGNVLVVDDTKFLRNMFTSILEHDVVGEAENGEEAIQKPHRMFSF